MRGSQVGERARSGDMRTEETGEEFHSIGSPKEDTGGTIGATDPVRAGLGYL